MRERGRSPVNVFFDSPHTMRLVRWLVCARKSSMRTCVQFLAGSFFVAACGLDVVGTAPTVTEVSSNDPIDNSLTFDDVTEAGASKGATDAAVDSPDPTDVTCSPVVMTETFDSDLDGWIHYGGVEHRDRDGVTYARLTGRTTFNRAAGLFWIPNVKTTAFKAKYSFLASRFMGGGDGLAFSWLSSTGASTLTAGVPGQGLGIPYDARGYALAFDVWRNTSIGDAETPSFDLLNIDPARGVPGSYNWHLATHGPFSSDLYNGWRTLEISVGAGKLSATLHSFGSHPTLTLYDNVPIDTSAPIVALGFTASTGSMSAVSFALDSVSIELENGSCP